MSRVKLATYVHVADEHDQMHVFGPEDTVPAWAAKKITNPGAWEGGKVPSSVEDPKDEAARLRARLAELEAQTTDGGDSGGSSQDGPPPKGGAGSGVQAWRDYANRNDVEVPEGASREDVIAALDGAGVRTE